MKKTMTILAALCMTMAANAFTEREMMPTSTSCIETNGEGIAPDKSPITKAETQELTKKLRHFLAEKEKALVTQQTYLEFIEDDDCDCYNMENFQMEWEGKFIDFLNENPKTLDLPEKQMEKLLGKDYKVVTSPDGRLRAYSWYTDRGGTWINFCSFIQYRTDDGETYVTWEFVSTDEEDLDEENGNMVVEEETMEENEEVSYEEYDDDDISWEWKSKVTKIHQLDTADGRIYLLQDYDVFSGLTGAQSIEALAITDNLLTYMPIFMVDGKKKPYLSYETTNKDASEVKFMTYNNKNKTIIVRQYEDNGEEYLSNDHAIWSKDNIIYQFDGKMFVER